ncbi:hypothetical protein OHA25_16580 [Nonomuraea sp. NBC_00507]|uniref:hypothetical protein n=1 Tax=Nonomuraea sp. NBC_00507 TaxID=2976002 RepID=UPI002E1783D0
MPWIGPGSAGPSSTAPSLVTARFASPWSTPRTPLTGSRTAGLGRVTATCSSHTPRPNPDPDPEEQEEGDDGGWSLPSLAVFAEQIGARGGWVIPATVEITRLLGRAARC